MYAPFVKLSCLPSHLLPRFSLTPVLVLSILQAPDEGVAATVAQGVLPRKLHHRQRLTRAQAIIQAAHNAKPVGAKQASTRKRTHSTAEIVKSKAPQAKTLSKTQKKKQAAGEEMDLWGEADGTDSDHIGRAVIPASKKRFKTAAGALPVVPAVEIDHPGCSYNPDYELHQDAIAVAVAAELRKQTDRELAPTAPLQNVVGDADADELAQLQVEIDDDDEEEGDDVGKKEATDDEEDDGVKRRVEVKRKTKQDRNRQARAKAARDEVERRRKEKKQRNELAALPELATQVEETLEGQEARRVRRHADLAEKKASEPPRLGRHKFEPMPLQVLTTDEVSGSLRRLKPTPVLAKERFKSLQRRGVIEPRHKVNKSGGKKNDFIRGERQDKAEERQRELNEIKAENKKLIKINKKK